MRTLSIALLAAALLGAVSSDADETAGKPRVDVAKPKPAGCFFIRDFESWRAAPDAKSILIRVDRRHILRLELAASCPTLTWPDARLITRWRGASSMCDALDWDLSVSQGPPGDIPMPCLVKKVVELTPEDIAALPKKQLP
jgi:hypothetical protein